jgi:cytochrome P450
MAGHETTSTGLTFTLHLLGRHPNEQQLVHDEIDAVLDGRPPSAEDTQALECTTRAIKEAMRLYPFGSRFAMLEATIAVAVLLQRCRIHSAPKDIPVTAR